MNKEQIEARLKEIENEMESDSADLDALEKEVRNLNEQKKQLTDVETRKQELRSQVGLGMGTPIIKPQAEKRKAYGIESKEYRDAWAKTFLCQTLSNEERQAIYDVQQRALGAALTTTAETFVTPTAGADGINNGGLFIPKEVSDKLLAEIALDSPILADVSRMAVRGMISFPYKVSATGAKWVEEGKCNEDESIEWATLSLTSKELSKTIRITWKLESMTPDSFVDYIIRELRREMLYALTNGVIYGDGSLALTGIAKSNLKLEYAAGDDLVETLIKSGDLLSKQNRMGAKLYISSELATKISLMKNKNGDYIMPPINGVGINKIGQYPVAIDPYLEKDDFALGNLQQGYILNEVEGVTITKDVSGKCRINDYTAYGVYAGAVVPNRVVFGTLSE